MLFDKYLYMVGGGCRTIELTTEEEAAVLAAYDHGLPAMGPEEINELHAVFAKLKEQIWP